jgi:hypothetical protein
MSRRVVYGIRIDPITSFSTAAFILGGATIVAGSMWRWVVVSGWIAERGIDRGEGQITVMLGLVAIAIGVLLPLIRSAWLEVLFAAAGCAIAAAVMSFAAQIISEYGGLENVLAFLETTMGEGPWILMAGGATVGASSLVCLAHGLWQLEHPLQRQ